MVYNALRLFMEINPELFDESMRQYRQKKIEYVLSSRSCRMWIDVCHHREQRAAVQRYEAWQKLRDIAVKNAGGKLPEGYKDIPHPPPPPPPAVEDQDIMELSMELNAATIDDVSDLDESGMERIPTADPGLEVETRVPLDVLH